MENNQKMQLALWQRLKQLYYKDNIQGSRVSSYRVHWKIGRLVLEASGINLGYRMKGPNLFGHVFWQLGSFLTSQACELPSYFSHLATHPGGTKA